MAEKRGGHSSTPSQVDLDAELNHVADQLYALTPDDFTAARDAAVRSAREAGQQALAREIGKLRKPTQSAWLVNRLWRDQHAVMEQLFELSHELVQAQSDAAGSTLRELTVQRRQLENALMRRAVELGTEAGVRVSDSVAREAQETLSAALALPEVADEVRSGHLVKPASYAGFGATAGGVAAASPKPRPAPIDLDAVRQRRTAEDTDAHAGRAAGDTDAHATGTAEETETELLQQRRAREEEERERAAAERRAVAERHLAQVRRDAERAAAHLADASRAANDARARVEDLQQRLDTLRAQLQRLESEVDTEQGKAAEADEQRRQAETNAAEAQQAVKIAEAALTD